MKKTSVLIATCLCVLLGACCVASPRADLGGFPPAHLARILHWEDVDNVRDLGGLVAKDGRVVRRGLVFRSQALNCNAVCDWLTAERLERKIRNNELLVEFGRGNGVDILRRIGTNNVSKACAEIAAELADGTNHWKRADERGTPESRRRILAETGLRTEIDLRSEPETWGMTGSPLGPSVAWYNIPGVQIAGLTTSGGKKSFSKCFRLFLDERNYPIDFHCIAGADRTGALAAALEALLGVSEEDIVIDYTLTSLSSSGLRRPESCTRQLRVFNKYPGATLNERVEAYVLDCGFTPEDIAKFRGIMLEK